MRATQVIHTAAAELRASSRAFTSKNLYHAALRVSPSLRGRLPYDAFRRAHLGSRPAADAIPGLLPPPATGVARGRVPDEWKAYFPAAILLVDRREIVDLFAASGILVQGRIAIVCIDGSPEPVVAWLRAGIRRGYRAPVGYLHDAATAFYPFLCEPLATLVEHARAGLVYRDLGLLPGSSIDDPLGLARPALCATTELEELPPCSLVAYAARELLGMLSPDPMLAPTRGDTP